MDLLEEISRALDAGWREFIRHEIKENNRRNNRLYKVIEAIKGSDYTEQVKALMQLIGSKDNLLAVVRAPNGVKLTERRFPLIGYVWIHGNADHGYMYIQIKEDRWIEVHYLKYSKQTQR